MKHPLESLMTVAGILLLAFLSCLLLPAPSLGLVLAQKLVAIFHLMDLNQFYTLLFCLWFLLLGVLEYLLLRFIWRRWFSLADWARENPLPLMRSAMIFFAISSRRLAERTGENTRKGLLRIESVFQTDVVHFLVGIA